MTNRPATAITRISFRNFTAFEELDFVPSPGINVLIGTNGTGKTHLMKVAYSACRISKTKESYADKLVRVFLPSGRRLGRLARRRKGHTHCTMTVYRGPTRIQISFTGRTRVTKSARIVGAKEWTGHPIDSVYIPVKEMLANAPGFQSLYSQRETSFEEVYSDIIDLAYLPPKLGPPDVDRQKLISTLREAMDGTVILKGQEFFLRHRGELEFTLLAEGIRKLGLLYLLIQNGSLSKGSILFWDEPETNLNPRLFKPIIRILLQLQRLGVQVFLATHDYVILKELDLQSDAGDKVVYHSLHRQQGGVDLKTSDHYLGLHENAISETFDDLYNRELDRSFPTIPKP